MLYLHYNLNDLATWEMGASEEQECRVRVSEMAVFWKTNTSFGLTMKRSDVVFVVHSSSD